MLVRDRYCECFAGGYFCHDDCGCMDCNNTQAFEATRAKVGHNSID
jgi:hypothetical protein